MQLNLMAMPTFSQSEGKVGNSKLSSLDFWHRVWKHRLLEQSGTKIVRTENISVRKAGEQN